MFDGSMNISTMDDEVRMKLRDSYLSRLRDGTQVPPNMKIQGVDVIDPTASRISHQMALSPEIDALFDKGKRPCIVIFAPISVKGVSVSEKFTGYSDPNLYAVVDVADASRLLGNSPEYQGLRNSVDRRATLQLG